jgi:hypothetical protein
MRFWQPSGLTIWWCLHVRHQFPKDAIEEDSTKNDFIVTYLFLGALSNISLKWLRKILVVDSIKLRHSRGNKVHVRKYNKPRSPNQNRHAVKSTQGTRGIRVMGVGSSTIKKNAFRQKKK